jgi:RimJ/RimL family protein N-acetyltransferase
LQQGVLQHIALRDTVCPALTECLPQLNRTRSSLDYTQRAVPALAKALSQGLSVEHAFILWRTSADAPHALISLASILAAAAPEVDVDALPEWRDALKNSCEQYFPPLEDEGFFRAVALVAVGLDAWGLARDALAQSMHLYGATLHDTALLARCHEATGDCPSALAWLDLARLEFPEEQFLIAEQQRVSGRVAREKSLDWYCPDLAASGALRIEPIGIEHAAAFFYQYRDTQIGMMARLPEFEDVPSLEAWITERGTQAGRAEYALMHAEYGFAGVVSAHRLADSAFMHFWIGVDHQGKGYSRTAAMLLLQQLDAWHCTRVFTAVYSDNHRSLTTLLALGFERLPQRAAAPDDKLIFLSLSRVPNDSLIRACRALQKFCAATGSAFAFQQHESSVK